MRKNKFKADVYEQDLEDNFEELERYPASIERKKMQKLQAAAKATLKKDTTITVRINSDDLARLIAIAKSEGLRYQTYLTQMIHKHVYSHR